FLMFGFHRRWWRYVSVRDMWSAARGVFVASIVAYVTVYFVSPVHNVRLPRSVAVMDLLITLALIAGVRLAARTLIERPGFGVVARGKEVLVVGAGDAGRLIVQEMQRSRMLDYTPIGFVDDDPRKRNTRLMGVRVLGTLEELPRVLREHRPDEVLIAMPSVSGDVRRQIVETAQQLRIVVKTLPGLYELITGEVGLAGQIRPVQVEDVLGREQVEVTFHEVAAHRRLPCRGLQAREDARDASPRVGAQQRRRHARDRRARCRVRRRAVRLHLDGQGRQPEDGDGTVEGVVRVDRRVVRPPARRGDPVRRRAFRQRPQLVGKRDPDLPQADRARRPGDPDPSRHDRGLAG